MIPQNATITNVSLGVDLTGVKLFRDKETGRIFQEREISDWGPMEPYIIPPMLRKTDTGVLFQWTLPLAQRKDMEPHWPEGAAKSEPCVMTDTPVKVPETFIADQLKALKDQIEQMAADNQVLRQKNRELLVAASVKKSKGAKKRIRAKVKVPVKLLNSEPAASVEA